MKNQKETSWDEIKAIVKETSLQMKETDRRFKETERMMKERFREIERMIREDTEKTKMMIRENSKQIGGITASNGEFCEEYFINTFKANPTFLGEKYMVFENPKPRPVVINDQYDLVLENGNKVVLIEMKYKAKVSDVKGMLLKLKSYRANFPMYDDYKIYLCLASFRFRDYVKARAAEEGIVLLQQRGEKIEVVSEKLKLWN